MILIIQFNVIIVIVIIVIIIMVVRIEKVSQSSRDVLIQYRTYADSQIGWKSDKNIFIVPRLLDIITSLPIIAQSGREVELVSKIKLVNGYLHLFGQWHDDNENSNDNNDNDNNHDTNIDKNNNNDTNIDNNKNGNNNNNNNSQEPIKRNNHQKTGMRSRDTKYLSLTNTIENTFRSSLAGK